MPVVGVIEVDLKAKIAGFTAAMTRAGVATQKTARGIAKSTLVISKSMAKMGLVLAPIGALMAKIGADFEQEMANVKAISGATAQEFEVLRESAERLGATTKFTATQVAQLQTEFSKLGFSAAEIVKVQKGTLDLASAIGSDLATAAAVAGATLRGFNLDADQTNRVTDVMAKSFSSSALDIEKFRESMKFIAPVANAAGFSIEQTAALLSVMADAGIAGSLAGTGLKRIMSELNNESGKLNKLFGGNVKTFDELVPALKKLKEGGFDLAAATQFLDERSKAAFLTLVNGSDDLAKLKKGYDEAGDSAKNMAEIQLDTLTGSLLELNSAFQGLSINVFQSQGFLAEATRTLTKNLQDLNTIIFGANTGTIVKQYDNATKSLADMQDLVLSFADKSIPELVGEFKKLGLVFDETKDRGLNFLTLIKAEEAALAALKKQGEENRKSQKSNNAENESLLRTTKLTVEELQALFQVRSQFNFKPIEIIKDDEEEKIMSFTEALSNMNLVFKAFVNGTLGQLKSEFPEIMDTLVESSRIAFSEIAMLAESLANTVSQFADIERAKITESEQAKTAVVNENASDRVDIIQDQSESEIAAIRKKARDNIITNDQAADQIAAIQLSSSNMIIAINAERETKISAIQDQAADERRKIRQKEKPFLIASAIANTAVGVTKAYEQGGVLGLITGLLITAAGAAQVATIQAQQFQTGGVIPGSGVGDKVPILAEPKEFMFNKATTNRIGIDNLENINAGGEFGGGDTFNIKIVTPTPATWEQFLKGEGRNGLVKTFQDITKRGQ